MAGRNGTVPKGRTTPPKPRVAGFSRETLEFLDWALTTVATLQVNLPGAAANLIQQQHANASQEVANALAAAGGTPISVHPTE